MIKIVNPIVQPHDLGELGSLSVGDTFIYDGRLAITISDGTEFMYLGGDRHGQQEEFGYNEADNTVVKLVDVEITVKDIALPPKPKAKAKKK